MASRDIRSQNGDFADGFTSVSEVIRIEPEPKNVRIEPEPKNVSFHETERTPPSKKSPNLAPIIIPSTGTPLPATNWGDCKTPGADDYELELAPLDEKLFETPTENVETYVIEEDLAAAATRNTNSWLPDDAKLNTVNNKTSETDNDQSKHAPSENFLVEQQQQKINLERRHSFQQLQEQLIKLRLHERELTQNPQLLQQNADQLQMVQHAINTLQQQLTSFNPMFIHQPTSSVQQEFAQQQPMQQGSNFVYDSSPSNQFSQFQYQQHQQYKQQNMQPQFQMLPHTLRHPVSPPIGSRFPYQAGGNRITTPSHGSYFSENIKKDETSKMKQLDAITRSLQAPSDMLDDGHLQQLQIAKEVIEKQLMEEQMVKDQMEIQWRQYQANQAMLLMQQEQENASAMVSKSENILPQGTSSDYINPRINEFGRQLNPEQLQYLLQLQSGLGREPSAEDCNRFVQEALQRHCKHQAGEQGEEKLSSINGPEIPAEVPEEQLQAVPVIDSKDAERKYETPNRTVQAEPYANKNVEIKKFEVVPLETFSIESKNDWIARELCNLTHPYLEHPAARFFTVISIEVKPGVFTSQLKRSYSSGYFWLHDSDADVFKNEWEKSDSPLFLIIKHRPYTYGTWKIGGICHVLSKVRRIPRDVVHQNNIHFQCHVKFISTALVVDVDGLRSEKATREIPNDMARKFIKHLINTIQQGPCENIFEFQEVCLNHNCCFFLDFLNMIS